MPPKVIAFDVFGTVFDLSGVNRSEVREYVDHIKQTDWAPLELPERWERLPAHDDAQAIRLLRQKHYVVALTNGPVRLITKLSKYNGISWDMIIPIECEKVYKPNKLAYIFAADLMGVSGREVMMVTANRTFGDIEAAAALGMQSYWIDRENGKTIWDLVEALGC